MRRLLRSEDGVKGVEMGLTLLLMGVLAAVATPFLIQARNSVDEVRAQADVRNAQVAARAGELVDDQSAIDEALAAIEPTDVGDIAVAGAQLERSADGATCLWSQSATGVFGIWERGGESLSARFDVKPEECPTRAEALDMGFAS